jgi:hypothetical protein
MPDQSARKSLSRVAGEVRRNIPDSLGGIAKVCY